MEIIQLFQSRMDKCQAEQFWAMALFASMTGFIILKNKMLVKSISYTLLQWGIIITGIFSILYIISRHFIYIHYDLLVNNIILSDKNISGYITNNPDFVFKILSLSSGVLFYIVICAGMALASIFVTQKTGRKRKIK